MKKPLPQTQKHIMAVLAKSIEPLSARQILAAINRDHPKDGLTLKQITSGLSTLAQTDRCHAAEKRSATANNGSTRKISIWAIGPSPAVIEAPVPLPPEPRTRQQESLFQGAAAYLDRYKNYPTPPHLKGGYQPIYHHTTA